MNENKENLLQKYVRIFFVVSGYWIVSIATVFINKKLLSGLYLDAPMFIAFYQTVISALVCHTMKILSQLFPGRIRFPESHPFALETVRNVLPLSVMFLSMIITNNLCLQNVSVAFYYIGRSLTTIFNVVFTFFILGERTSARCIACCFVIIFGFYLGVDQEQIAGSLSVAGTIFGVLGSLSLSLYSIFTKRVLPKIDEEIWLLSYYNNIYSSIILIPIVVIAGEVPEVTQYEGLTEWYFWTMMTVGGLSGFAIGFFTSLQIKVTSALTHNISGTAKACAQTVLATYWYNHTKSGIWWLSNGLVLFGSAAYARIKQLDMELKYKGSPSYTKV